MEGKAGIRHESNTDPIRRKTVQRKPFEYTNNDAYGVLPSSVVQGVVQRRLRRINVLLHVHKRPDGKEFTVGE